jgi:conjugative transfer region protein (TIGR03748 family)
MNMSRMNMCMLWFALLSLMGCASKQTINESVTSVESRAEKEACSHATYVKTDRYTLANTSPLIEQREPMAAIVHMRFAQDVSTVGQAIRELLEGSGYRLVMGENRVEMQDQILLTQQLPAVHQELGPVNLLDALTILGGRAWQVHVDHVYRLVWFQTTEVAHQVTGRVMSE